MVKLVLQRVIRASVRVGGEDVGTIGRGVVVLMGIHRNDGQKEAEYACRKILNTRLWKNEKSGKSWDRSVVQMDYEVLMVSQFTLYGYLKGNKPDFHLAMKSDSSREYYDNVVQKIKDVYKADKIQQGSFGDLMEVELVNDGPVSLVLESPSTVDDEKET